MNRIDYRDFVRERFKVFHSPLTDDKSGLALALTLHHATTGLLGEAVEVKYARSRDQLLKELGDYLFYFEALEQNLPPSDLNRGGSFGFPTDLPGLFDFLIARTTDVHDLTKKMWIYEQAIDMEQFWDALPSLRGALMRIMEFVDTHMGQIIALNVAKLTARYPSGYSNAAAQARADGDPGQILGAEKLYD